MTLKKTKYHQLMTSIALVAITLILTSSIVPNSAEAASSTRISVKILKVIQIDNPEAHAKDSGDFYAKIKIGDNERNFKNQRMSGTEITPNWTHTVYVDKNSWGNTVPIYIELRDYDKGSGDEWMDISPSNIANNLNLQFNLDTKEWYGDISYPSQMARGDGHAGKHDRDRAIIEFEISPKHHVAKPSTPVISDMSKEDVIRELKKHTDDIIPEFKSSTGVTDELNTNVGIRLEGRGDSQSNTAQLQATFPWLYSNICFGPLPPYECDIPLTRFVVIHDMKVACEGNKLVARTIEIKHNLNTTILDDIFGDLTVTLAEGECADFRITRGGDIQFVGADVRFAGTNRSALTAESPASNSYLSVGVNQQDKIVETIKTFGTKKETLNYEYDPKTDQFYPLGISNIMVDKSVDFKISKVTHNRNTNAISIIELHPDKDEGRVFVYDKSSDTFHMVRDWENRFPPECRDADKLNKIGNFEHSLYCHKGLSEMYPEERYPKINAIIALLGLERFDDASIAVEQIESEGYGVSVVKALLEYRKQNYDEAKSLYENVLSVNPGSPDANAGLGNVLRMLGDISGASYRYYLADKYATDPTEKAVAKNAFGLMHQMIFDKTKQIGNLDTAESFHDVAVLLDDENVDGYNGKGSTLVIKGIELNDDSLCIKAKKSFEKTLSIYDENKDALKGMKLVAECEKKTQQNK